MKLNWKSAPAKKFLSIKAQLEAAAKLSPPSREWGKPYMTFSYEEDKYSVRLFASVDSVGMGTNSQRCLGARLRTDSRTSLKIADWTDGANKADTTAFWLEFERYMAKVSAQ